jgi:hypothetical protein
MDDAIELYQKSGTNYLLMQNGSENSASGVSDFERLNYQGLTPGITYYVAVGSAGGAGGAFSLCIQHLMPGGCAYSIPAAGFSLCGNYKSIYRGSTTQGVTYGFNFTGTGGTAPQVTTSISGTNGLVSLSNPLLSLRYGGIYDVTIDVNYALYNGAGQLDNIVVEGNAASVNCSGVWIMSHPMLEVKPSQRCMATLLRSNYLIGTPTAGATNASGATSFTYEFTQVVSCDDATSATLFPIEYTTAGAAPYLPLGVLPLLTNQGAWSVRIRPNFQYGVGSYGPAHVIQINNTAASGILPNGEVEGEKIFSINESFNATLYPNPGDGSKLTIDVSNVVSEFVFVEVIDETGRQIRQDLFASENSMSIMLLFQQPLASGLYMIRIGMNDQIQTERMIVH